MSSKTHLFQKLITALIFKILRRGLTLINRITKIFSSMEHQTLLDELNSQIEYYSKKTDHPPSRIRIGYKTYYKLMQNPKFADEVSNSALDPNKRKYRKLKIKVTKDDDQLELE